MRLLLFVLNLFLVAIELCSSLEQLETFSDADIQELISNEKYVAVLFPVGKNIERSNDLETELASLREYLVDSIDAFVVKATEDSALRQQFFTEEESTVVFFRRGKPVLYDGPADEEIMLERIQAFKDPCLRELSDSSFEHLTQASTGATTGDWFVLFGKDECPQCEKLEANLETLACTMLGKANVARMDRETTGAATGRRFGVSTVPDAIFFRHGKMYRYNTIGKYDFKSMKGFMSGFYKNVAAESIPPPKTPFDDLVQYCVDQIRENPVPAVGAISIPIILILSFYMCMGGSPVEKRKKKEKRNKKKD